MSIGAGSPCAGLATDGYETAIMQRVVGQLVGSYVLPNVGRGPVSEGIELYELALSVEKTLSV